jgi:hypothetical protein
LNDLRKFVQQFTTAVAVCSACWCCFSQQWYSIFRAAIGDESPVLILWNIMLKLMLAMLIKLFYGRGSLITMFARLQHWFEFSSGHVYWTPWCVTYLVQVFFLNILILYLCSFLSLLAVRYFWKQNSE